ncbi:heavy metal transporter [Streptomyces sp. NPDC046985]|uniref:heavy metal transporter n=1 Tax=Streptomyces sp. NPDC046985 TaxID=3155377 RepID=UPI0033D65843
MPEPSLTPKRRGRLLRIGAALTVLLAVAGYLVVQYLTGGAGAPGCKVVSADGHGASYEFTPEQAVNAATIAAVGTGRGMPERAVTIALATALQESGLRNVGHGDRDSLGLFQQRPSQGWGAPEQIMDPAYAAGVFYQHLAKVPDYAGLPLTVAAQRVQRSGFPEAYAKHEPDAALLSAALTGRAGGALTCQGRPGAARATGPDAVRAALVRDFGRQVLEQTGAQAGGRAAGRPSPSGSAGAAGATGAAGADGSAGADGRTVTLPVRSTAGASGAKGGARGGDARQRGWQLAHWAVANASALHIESVAFAGRQWSAGVFDGGWRPADGKNGDAAGGPGATSVRITAGR